MSVEMKSQLAVFAPGGSFLSFWADGRAGAAIGLQLVHSEASPLGEKVFARDWLDPADGLSSPIGPGFDATRCAACHIEMSPARDHQTRPLDLLIARPVSEKDRIAYGDQLHRRRTDAIGKASSLEISSSSSVFVYPDGSERRLTRRQGLVTGPDGSQSPVALRVPPLLYGWGLLAHVDFDMLRHFHDPDDRDGDGISGRLSPVSKASGPGVGILGWKGSHSTLRDQISAALSHDMGIQSTASCKFDRDRSCRSEIGEHELAELVRFTEMIGVPHRREGATLEGETLFGQMGCASCHTPVLVTGTHEQSELSDQIIWAYSDLMLHDMGPELSDPGDSPLASEWRTAPLWSAGIVEQYFPERGFLHDGRARSIEEAILWHGGEARAARDAFINASRQDREQLLNYVRAL